MAIPVTPEKKKHELEQSAIKAANMQKLYRAVNGVDATMGSTDINPQALARRFLVPFRLPISTRSKYSSTVQETSLKKDSAHASFGIAMADTKGEK